MLLTKTSGKKTEALKCLRCGGRMIFEKFYDVNNIFFAWHCIFCGEVLDPIILLHRLSKNADLKIPEDEENIMLLLKQYLNPKSKKNQEVKI